MTQLSNVASAADKVEGQPVLKNGARAGYALNGVLHLMIAWIALQIAWTASGTSADQSGALQTLAGSSLGRLALWAAVLGFLALGLWQLASAVAVRTRGESSQWAVKVKGISKAVVYLALAWTSFSFAKGQPSSSKAQTRISQPPCCSTLVAGCSLRSSAWSSSGSAAITWSRAGPRSSSQT